MHTKTKQALIVAAIASLLSIAAHASPVFCVNGKETSQGDAVRLQMKNPGTQVIKVQVSKVALNDATMRMKKSDDVKLSNPCSIK